MKFYGGNNDRKKRKAPEEYDEPSIDDTRVVGRFEDDDDALPPRTPEEKRHIDDLIDKYQKFKRRKRFLIFAILLVIAAAAAIFWKSFIKPPDVVAPTPTPTQSATLTPTAAANSYTRKQGVYTFLVLGKDVEAGLTDTILVGSIDTVNNTINVVSIPRDTLLNVSRSYKKVNGIYSHNGDDIEKAKAELKSLLGFTVDMYAVVDIKAFQKIVDTIGGVDFNVPINMDYDDDIQDFHVHLLEGQQHLTGTQALGVVRFRQNNEDSVYGAGYPDADIGRIATQQSFMKTVAKQCLSVWNATKVNEFAQIFKDYVDTNLSSGNMVWFGLQFLNIKSDNISFMTLPAKYDDYELGVNCVTVNIDDWITMINTKISPYKEEITKDKLNVLALDKNGKFYSTSGVIQN